MQTTPTQTNKLHRQLIAGVALSLALAPAGGPAAQAKDDSVFLLETQCVSTGSGRWRKAVSDISVGRQVYTSFLYMGPGTQFSGLVCRIRPENSDRPDPNFQTLQLEFGMRDSDTGSPPTTVKVYLDGTAAASQTLSPGEKASVALDVSKIRNVAIETACTSQSNYCDRVYFFRASLDSSAAPTQNQLERIPPSPPSEGSPSQPPPASPNSPKPGLPNP